jgi:xanthine dehydrogenase molybdopterin binding subunit
MAATNNTITHESAELHVSGEALYIDDIPANDQLLAGYVVGSPHPHARIKSFDLREAKKVPGVCAVLSYKDIPGHNQMGPIIKDEPCLAHDETVCIGQAVFLIAAETLEQCRDAERKITVEYEILEPVLSIDEAMRQNTILGKPMIIQRGDVDEALRNGPNVIRGELRTGAQEHWYLETQSSLCVPGEAKELVVYSSTQHPSETQALIAEVLGIGKHEVQVEVRRMGGGFGGKETQGNHAACWAALLCHATKRPVKISLDRDQDMKITGKRHRFLSKYEAAFDKNGVLLGVNIELNSDGGCATDLSHAILERALLHSDNSYYVPNFRVVGRVWKTNLPSNTAFRGFGGPQGIAVIETIIDRIARLLKKDPVEIRSANFYGIESRNTTHYEQLVDNNRLPVIYSQLMKSSDYLNRRKAINAFNAENEFYKKGIALTPVKFGISFTTTFLNQAGALVHVYKDGTVLVNQGGTEMGQGLFTKIRQIAAVEFGVPLDRIKVNATNTAKVPNTSATAASSGADLNGMAVKNAVDIIKGRVAAALAKNFSDKNPGNPSQPQNIIFENNEIFDRERPDRKIPFPDAMELMNLMQVSLSASGFYKTPTIGWDKVAGRGKPFFYYAFGMAATEVLVDVLTGDLKLLRADILHDVGDSLNPAIDRGQIEGGYIQGCGWVTTEEIKWDARGNLMTHSPDTYKIPTVNDIPADFRVKLLEGNPNGADTIRRSKAVGEPPLMLAFSTWLAIKDAISAVGNHAIEPEFSLPATNEVILLSIERLKMIMQADAKSRKRLPQNKLN